MSSNRSKRWFSSAFESNAAAATANPISTEREQVLCKKLKKSFVHEEQSTLSIQTESSADKHKDWSIDLAPKTVSDLAVHPKKLDELKHWFNTYERLKTSDPVAILLISGPPGSGKSTALKLIAVELGFSIAEWTTPVDVDLFWRDNYDFESNDRGELVFRESQKQAFDKFLYKTSRYCSIFESPSDEKLLVVKDIPNVFLKEPKNLQESLEAYRASGASPLVFIATDTSHKDLDIVFNLFPPTVLQEYKITHITFNSVSTTLMKKAMKRITSLMGNADMTRSYRIPPQEMFDSIILSSAGDLRNATLNMHFASLKNAPRLATEILPLGEILNTTGTGGGKANRAKKKESKLKSVGCNENLTMMHALGRVFNPKFESAADGKQKFHHSPEDLSDAFISQPTSLITLMHSNYVSRFTDIEDIIGAAEALSLADVIMKEYREDQLAGHGLNIVIRGMMVNNRRTAGGWQPIKKKKQYAKPSVSSHAEQLRKYGLEVSSISASLFITEFKKYIDIIQPAKA